MLYSLCNKLAGLKADRFRKETLRLRHFLEFVKERCSQANKNCDYCRSHLLQKHVVSVLCYQPLNCFAKIFMHVWSSFKVYDHTLFGHYESSFYFFDFIFARNCGRCCIVFNFFFGKICYKEIYSLR